jgi:hypothetical protein
MFQMVKEEPRRPVTPARVRGAVWRPRSRPGILGTREYKLNIGEGYARAADFSCQSRS